MKTLSVTDIDTTLDAQLIRKIGAARFVEFMGDGETPVAIPEGMMAVTLTLCYDNSDIVTDYFDRHANLSPEFLLLLVKKQAQTEKLARKAMEIAFPELVGSSPSLPTGNGRRKNGAWATATIWKAPGLNCRRI
ncbi:MAG: hypothetical protein KGL39_36890 [Patescibacteria group bacterium]|nr:hypothetical protein [Patescibacteria group bacterium]